MPYLNIAFLHAKQGFALHNSLLRFILTLNNVAFFNFSLFFIFLIAETSACAVTEFLQTLEVPLKPEDATDKHFPPANIAEKC